MNVDRVQHALSARTVFTAEERSAIPINEDGETLVQVSEVLADVMVRLIVPTRKAYVGRDALWARASVCAMLGKIAKNIAPRHRLLVFDAYRPLEYQYWRFSETLKKLRLEYPSLSGDELDRETDRLVARPDSDPTKPPPHSTGGAVDLLLTSSDGASLDFGSQPGIYTAEENSRHWTNTTLISTEQRNNRIRLVTAALEVGFENYPGEWWHFMFGEQEHALYAGLPVAKFGRADLMLGPHNDVRA